MAAKTSTYTVKWKEPLVQNGSYFGGRFGPRFLGHNDPNFRAESAQERGQNQIDRGRFGFREGRFGFSWGSKQSHKKNGPITNGRRKRANLAQLWAINDHTRSCMESTLFTHKARNVAKALYWYHQDSHHIKEIVFGQQGHHCIYQSLHRNGADNLSFNHDVEKEIDLNLQQLWFVDVLQ